MRVRVPVGVRGSAAAAAAGQGKYPFVEKSKDHCDVSVDGRGRHGEERRVIQRSLQVVPRGQTLHSELFYHPNDVGGDRSGWRRSGTRH